MNAARRATIASIAIEMSFQGIIFDVFDETIVERSCVERATEEEAFEDAKRLLPLAPGFDEGDCFVYDVRFGAVIFND